MIIRKKKKRKYYLQFTILSLSMSILSLNIWQEILKSIKTFTFFQKYLQNKIILTSR